MHSDIKESFAKIGTKVLLRPVYGNKRWIEFKRTKIVVTLRKDCDIVFDGINLQLPVIFDDEQAQFVIELESNSKIKTENNSYYLVRSVGSHFFKHNGNRTRESLLERNDTLNLNGNLLSYFKKETIEEVDLDAFSKTKLFVLLEGETGTGKTTIAKKIHDKSNRVGEFIHINLSAFSENLIESELFGHKKGAFTGAINDKKGAIEMANYGTLFIDEIDSISKEIQLKLLLFLDNYKFRPVGSHLEKSADVKVILASGRKLEDLIETKEMRKDFYFRLKSGLTKNLRPLREDPKKVEEIIDDFCKNNDVSISLNLVKLYKSLDWPGNIRQFISHLNKKKELSHNKKLDFDFLDEELLNFPIEIVEDKGGIDTLLKVKKSYIQLVYQKVDCSIKKAAKILDITTHTVRNNIGVQINQQQLNERKSA